RPRNLSEDLEGGRKPPLDCHGSRSPWRRLVRPRLLTISIGATVARDQAPSSSAKPTGSLAPPPPESLPFALPPRSVVGHRFEIARRAGSGGMGAVYRALDQTTGEVVAVKVLHMTGTQNTARFEREARILAELRHPAVARYVAHGTTETLQPFLAMEWLDGE